MGLHANGGIIATKPYIASVSYINKMSDYCAACRFNPKLRHGQDVCPFNILYLNFLIQHEQILRSGPRMGSQRAQPEADWNRVAAGNPAAGW